MAKNDQKLLKIEYWGTAPIIVDGIIASNFFHANLVNNTLSNKR